LEADANSWRLLTGRMMIAGSNRAVPLYLIAPSAQRLVLPIFRVPPGNITVTKTRPPG
jgi:hypothetical protein